MKHTYRPMLDDRLSLRIHVVAARTQKLVLGYAAANKIDLLVLWKDGDLFSSLFAWVHAQMFSRKSGCPVLSLDREAGGMAWKNIVLPVQDVIPTGKLMLAIRVAGLCKAKIHLVRVVSRGADGSGERFFLKACQLLQYHRNIEVECKMLEGMSLSGTIVKYTAAVDADVLLVCAGKKSLIYGCLSLLLPSRRSAFLGLSVITIPTEELNVL